MYKSDFFVHLHSYKLIVFMELDCYLLNCPIAFFITFAKKNKK